MLMCFFISDLWYPTVFLLKEHFKDFEVHLLKFGVVDNKPGSAFDAKTSYCTGFMAWLLYLA